MFKMYRASLLTVGLLLCCEAHGQDLKVYVNKKGKVDFAKGMLIREITK